MHHWSYQIVASSKIYAAPIIFSAAAAILLFVSSFPGFLSFFRLSHVLDVTPEIVQPAYRPNPTGHNDEQLYYLSK